MPFIYDAYIGYNMTTIEVKMASGKYRTLEFQKPFDDITASEIMEMVNGCIWGWNVKEVTK